VLLELRAEGQRRGVLVRFDAPPGGVAARVLALARVPEAVPA
jgi:hypothetical protein